ncbi:hypothetical protein [Sphingomonas colocasiae]|uniref:Uncharacterized protein n=1 Tax=Sphingomonas colocasiae TaxID=1848973 RepID=A0ABS7PVC0_9SPHN|nr:hypothetical protein [Sphingomonas colocasiae]MBY8825310.1 hypothetical protein [Sphingomonas colocasiae]
MRHAIPMAAVAAALLATSQGAQAQGFLKRLADRALDKAERTAETIGESAARGSPRGRKAKDRREAAPAAAPAASEPVGPAGPARAAPAAARYIDSLRTPPDVEAQKTAYNRFGEVSCNDCEGGIDLDGRPKFAYDQYSGKYNERAARAGSWPVGHTHNWQGRASKGTLTVLAEESVDGFRCRRLEYRLVRGDASATRPGLICFGLANSSSEVEKWHEIY